MGRPEIARMLPNHSKERLSIEIWQAVQLLTLAQRAVHVGQEVRFFFPLWAAH